MTEKTHQIHTRIWREEASPQNPFVARKAFCHGYDVFGSMLGAAGWADMLFLLFRGAAPGPHEAAVLENLAVALANPGPRDPSVHAAMCAGSCGSPAASALMAALAVGAGGFGGAHEVRVLAVCWAQCNFSLSAWMEALQNVPDVGGGVWPELDHAPGFDPAGREAPLPVIQLLDCLAGFSNTPRLGWLRTHHQELGRTVGGSLTMSAVAAAALADTGFTPEQSEYVFLLLRLPGAAAHALEQSSSGYKSFPFGHIHYDGVPVPELADDQ